MCRKMNNKTRIWASVSVRIDLGLIITRAFQVFFHSSGVTYSRDVTPAVERNVGKRKTQRNAIAASLVSVTWRSWLGTYVWKKTKLATVTSENVSLFYTYSLPSSKGEAVMSRHCFRGITTVFFFFFSTRGAFQKETVEEQASVFFVTWVTNR